MRLPFSTPLIALPVLVELFHPKEWNQKHGRRQITPAELMGQLLAVLIRWFPERKFRFVGDGGFWTRDLAHFTHRLGNCLALVSGL